MRLRGVLNEGEARYVVCVVEVIDQMFEFVSTDSCGFGMQQALCNNE